MFFPIGKRLIIPMGAALLLLMSLLLLLSGIRSEAAGEYEYAMFPMEYMTISQGENSDFSHKNSLAMDFTGQAVSLREGVYAPFSCTVKNIVSRYGGVWIQSNDKVRYADGSLDYMTVLLIHCNDVSGLSVGDTFAQGELFYREGTAGNVTGMHVHIECARGPYTTGNLIYAGYYTMGGVRYGIYNLPGQEHLYNCFFVDSTVQVKSDRGYNWKKITNEDWHPLSGSVQSDVIYRADANLNVRSGAGTDYSTMTVLPAGTYVHVSSIYLGIWGKITYDGVTGWINLSYCTEIGKTDALQRTLNYVDNGGSGGPGSQKIYTFEKNFLSTQQPVRNGYRFLGWADSPDAAVAAYQPGQAWEGGNATFYAVWELQSYRVTFHPRGGNCETASKTLIYGEAYGTLPIAQREGYTFLGWYTASSVEVTARTVFTAASDQTLYAGWALSRPGAFQISASGQELSVLLSWTDSQNATAYQVLVRNAAGALIYTGARTAGKEATVTLSPGKYSCSVLAYNQRDGSSSQSTASREVSFTVGGRSLFFEMLGGVGGPVTQYGETGKMVTIPAQFPQRKGYRFDGWTEDADYAEQYACGLPEEHPAEGRTIYHAGDPWTAQKDTTLWALWSPEVYDVQFDAAGGIQGPERAQKLHGVTLTLSGEIPVRAGFIFMGWSKTKDSSEINWTPGSYYEENESRTLYAVWRDPSSFILRSVGSLGDRAYLILEEPVLRGSADAICRYFGGSLAVARTTEESAFFQKLSEEIGKTLFWDTWEDGKTVSLDQPEKIGGIICALGPYSVCYETGIPGEISAQSKVYGCSLQLSGQLLHRAGWVFLGWTEEPGNPENHWPDYLPGGSYCRDEAITLYPVWMKLNNAPKVTLSSRFILPIAGSASLPSTRIDFAPKGGIASQAIQWESSNPEVAVVDQAGNIVTGVPGVAILKAATAYGTAPAFCMVYVPRMTLLGAHTRETTEG